MFTEPPIPSAGSRPVTCGDTEGQPANPVLSAVFRELERHGVRSALLRSPVDPTVHDAGDIDVLVHGSDALKAESVFRALGFVRLPRAGSHFLRYDASSDQWLWFHVVHELSFGAGRIVTKVAEACLERRSTGAMPPKLAPDDTFWALLLHCALDKGRIASHHRRTLQELAALSPHGGPVAAFVERLGAAAPHSVTAGSLVGMVTRQDWTAAVRTLVAAAGEPDLGRRSNAWGSVLARARRMRARWPPLRYRGLSVAILGPDGAGKSTLAAGIAGSFKLPVRVMYMGLTGGALRQMARLRVPGVVFAGRALVIWQRYLRARFHQSRGRLVVFDRYILDSAIPHPQQLNRFERLARRLDGYLCPSPDLVLVLDAPGELMHARKGEYSPEMLEDWRRHFLALRNRIPQVEVIDATQDKDAVRIDATNRIWRRYEQRWSRARAAV